MSSPKTIFIAAGGTGGHVFPAKRVAQKFIKEGFKVIWIGTNRGPEKNICKELDISFIHCLLYTSPSPRDRTRSRMPSSA